MLPSKLTLISKPFLLYYFYFLVSQGTLRNGTVIAAKVLSAESKQGLKEFLTEIDIITRVKHPNLVELLGYCVQENDQILVYEYVENNSLDYALLGKPNSKLPQRKMGKF